MKYKRLLAYKLKGVRRYFYHLREWVNENGELVGVMGGEIHYRLGYFLFQGSWRGISGQLLESINKGRKTTG